MNIVSAQESTNLVAERSETIQLAQQTLDGYTVWNVARGAATSVIDGAYALIDAAYTGFKAVVLQDEQAQAQASAALGASWDFVIDPANWPQLLGAMSPAQREQLAQAYERGDGQAVAALLGEQLTNLPTGGGMGTVKTVVRGADRAQEAAVLLQRADVETVVHAPAGVKGDWDAGINTATLQPRTAYMLDNGHTYITDSSGRVKNVEGTLSLEKRDRNDYQQGCAGQSGCVGDDGGHLIAASLGGAGDRINVVPQESTLNRSDWRKMENEFRTALNEGKTVEVKIAVGYPNGDGVRPNKFIVEAYIDGQPYRKEFDQ